MSALIGMKKIRKQKGYSQVKVAMDLSMTQEAISLYETGKRSPDINTLLIFSDYFDVSVDYLIKGEEFTPKYRRTKSTN